MVAFQLTGWCSMSWNASNVAHALYFACNMLSLHFLATNIFENYFCHMKHFSLTFISQRQHPYLSSLFTLYSSLLFTMLSTLRVKARTMLHGIQGLQTLRLTWTPQFIILFILRIQYICILLSLLMAYLIRTPLVSGMQSTRDLWGSRFQFLH